MRAAVWTRIRCSSGFGVGMGRVVRMSFVDAMSGWRSALMVVGREAVAIFEDDDEKRGRLDECETRFE